MSCFCKIVIYGNGSVYEQWNRVARLIEVKNNSKAIFYKITAEIKVTTLFRMIGLEFFF